MVAISSARPSRTAQLIFHSIGFLKLFKVFGVYPLSIVYLCTTSRIVGFVCFCLANVDKLFEHHFVDTW